MHILLTGANGFIGGHILAALLQAGHEVTAAVRDPGKMQRRFPSIRAVAIDMNRATAPEDWRDALEDVDAVVNCAGILQSRPGQSAQAIHSDAPIALFTAAAQAGVRRIIQISAVSIGTETEYARSKKAADDFLVAQGLDWTVMRPSLVYAEGSYGGTSLFRALAALPFAIPVIGSGRDAFTPIHAADLAVGVLICLEEGRAMRQVIEPCGPDHLSLKDILIRMRGWLGFGKAPTRHIPIWLISPIARVGDLLGAGPVTTTSLVQLRAGNCADPEAYEQAIGHRPRSFDHALQASPAQVQDRLHARTYFLRPLLWLSLVLLWLASGLMGLLAPADAAAPYLSAVGLPVSLSPGLALATGLLDLCLAAMVFLRWRPQWSGLLQLATVAGFTLFLSVAAPALWLDLFGPLLKNLPILAAIAVWMAMEDER